MMMDKNQEKEALKALLKALSQGEGDEEEEGEYVEGRRETSVSPEEVEGELYDAKEGIREDAEETLEDEEEDYEADMEDDEPMSLKDLVASFMNESEDPFADKKGLPAMGGGSIEIEVKKEGMMPAKALAKKALAMKKAKKRMRGM